MNYLAHLYLSGTDRELMFGNFIADHVKGSNLTAYSTRARSGILLHREIDYYTDHHVLTDIGKQRLRESVRKYAPVALDVIYDHYLASNWNMFSDESLSSYVAGVYNYLDSRVADMPERARYMYGYMRKGDWLQGYAYTEGVERALNGLARRTKFESNLNKAFDAMMDSYDLFKNEFIEFFPQLKNFMESVKTTILDAEK